MNIVIFAGGIGTRMWPVSRVKTPKQFNPVLDNKSTLELMYEHIHGQYSPEQIYVGTNAQYANLITEKLTTLPQDHVFKEPAMRDLGPAVGYACAMLSKTAPNEPVAILWSDDLIKKRPVFLKVLKQAEEHLKHNPNQLVYIGQQPLFADQNKGWIHYGKAMQHRSGVSKHEFKDFHYRPPLEIAQQYFRSGEHAVNTGYFVSTPQFIMELYQRFAPDVHSQLMALAETRGTPDHDAHMQSIYPQLEKISFDDLIVSKTSAQDAVALITDMGWYGFGDWEAIKEALQESPQDNVTKGNVYPVDTKDTIVYSYTDQLITPIGLEGMVVVATPDAIMICPKSAIPEVKKMLKKFEGTENEKYL